ncbi:MAG: formate dehydrogenase accessory sulfurtransferase FdhD [Spirochaetota bacterium]
MPLPEYKDIDVNKYSRGRIKPFTIPLSSEYTFTMHINGTPYAEIACSGSGMEEFAIGHLLSNSIIRSNDDIREVVIDENGKEINIITGPNAKIPEKTLPVKFIASAGGKTRKGINSDLINTILPIVKASTIIKIMDKFVNHSNLHDLTHGVHSSGLYSADGEMLAFYDDIGRHNAVDKSLGFAIKNSINLHDKMIILTGRLASEIVYKAINAGVPVIISRASTTTRGFELAVKHNIILIGRVRTNSFIIFNGKDNISC